MEAFKSFESLLYSVNDQSFSDIALSLFRFQAEHNIIYRKYIQNLSIDVQNVKSIGEIPFLPISFFKNHKVITGNWNADVEFTSSGTTGLSTSRHYIYDEQFYLKHAQRCFEEFFGPLSDYHIFAYLPSYLERKNSSLIAMMDHFIKQSDSSYSGFYLHNVDQLLQDVADVKHHSKKTIVWGVSFALLALAETQRPDLSHCIVFETGGMKGRRKEMTRQELHSVLEEGLNVKTIYSEYGMTELLSQAYSTGKSFTCSRSMKVIIRDITDPFRTDLISENGGINVIDLANWHSIAFIETEDMGRLFEDHTFEVLGRMDNSDIRGCNLMV